MPLVTWIAYEGLSDTALVSQMVLELQGDGHLLAYDDYLIIKRWTSLCSDRQVLYDTLSTALPDYYRHGPRSLKGIDKKITKLLASHR